MNGIRQAGLIRRTTMIAAALLALAGCAGEESNVDPQQPTTRSEATGLIVDGIQIQRQTIVGKGAAGLTRASSSSDVGSYALSLTELTAPYLFANSLSPSGNPDLIFMTSVATRAGVVNVTPLTTLLTAQLLGVAPGAAYTSFDASGSSLPGRVTDPAILAAQLEVTALLRDVYGVQVQTGQASFIDTPFSPVAGNAMFDTIQALNTKLAESHISLAKLSSDIAVSARACQTEQVLVSIGGVQGRFCPLAKTALPDEADDSILIYSFRSIRNEELTIRVRMNSILGVMFRTSAGNMSACTGSTCTGIALGVLAADETRTINIAGLALSGAAGAVTLGGNIVGAQPFVSLPTLPCADNRFVVIFDDHHAVGDCVTPNHPLPLEGTFGGPAGPGRDGWNFSNSSDPQPFYPHVEIVLDMSTTVPTVNYVYYSEVDPDTFQTRNMYVCQLAACSGVTVGPRTVNNSAGFPIQVFNITFDNTVLSGMDETGAATGHTLKVQASFTAMRDPSASVAYPSLESCIAPASTIQATGFGPSTFNLCIPENDIDNGILGREAYDMGDGDLQLLLRTEMWDQVVLFLHNGVVVEVSAQLSSTGEYFGCKVAGCAGVTVSAPDGQGRRTVGFSNAMLHHVESFPRPGDRTLRLTGAGIVVPPP
jgi:hypothetical protein